MDQDLTALLRDVAEIGSKVDGLTVSVRRLIEDSQAAKVAADATREYRAKAEATLAQLPDRTAELERRLQAIEARPGASILSDPAVREWSLRVVWYAGGAAVAVALALAGGMTYADIGGAIGRAMQAPAAAAP